MIRLLVELTQLVGEDANKGKEFKAGDALNIIRKEAAAKAAQA